MRVMTTAPGVRFRRILNRVKIIADGNYREEQDNQNCERNKWQIPLRTLLPSVSHPQANTGHRQKSPRDIEKEFHACLIVYEPSLCPGPHEPS